MRYYLDTEFAEKPGSIKLISLALVSEVGAELYYENGEFDPGDANDWVRAHVLPNLQGGACRASLIEIRDAVLTFLAPRPRMLVSQATTGEVLDAVKNAPKPEIWGYYADYDWVVFCWLFGAMAALPRDFPKYCRDLKQDLDAAGNPRVPIPKPTTHNALHDARWNREAHEWLRDLARVN